MLVNLFIFSYLNDLLEVNSENPEALNLFKVDKKDTRVIFNPHCGACMVIFEYIHYIKGSSRTFAYNIKQIWAN